MSHSPNSKLKSVSIAICITNIKNFVEIYAVILINLYALLFHHDDAILGASQMLNKAANLLPSLDKKTFRNYFN